MRAVAYIRVSDLSQVEGYSLDAQERLFLQHCKTKGWTPIQVYREEGRSAHSDSIRKRPVFRQLLEDASQGQFDVVVVHTLDRWARNQRVMLESLAVLAEHEVALASLSENIDYSTPQGRLFIQMLGRFAQYFSDSLAAHVSKGLTQRAIQGRHVGGIPSATRPAGSPRGRRGKPLQSGTPRRSASGRTGSQRRQGNVQGVCHRHRYIGAAGQDAERPGVSHQEHQEAARSRWAANVRSPAIHHRLGESH